MFFNNNLAQATKQAGLVFNVDGWPAGERFTPRVSDVTLRLAKVGWIFIVEVEWYFNGMLVPRIWRNEESTLFVSTLFSIHILEEHLRKVEFLAYSHVMSVCSAPVVRFLHWKLLEKEDIKNWENW